MKSANEPSDRSKQSKPKKVRRQSSKVYYYSELRIGCNMSYWKQKRTKTKRRKKVPKASGTSLKLGM